eukprot:15485178-Alexandrium_andersonii.AAC.1
MEACKQASTHACKHDGTQARRHALARTLARTRSQCVPAQAITQSATGTQPKTRRGKAKGNQRQASGASNRRPASDDELQYQHWHTEQAGRGKARGVTDGKREEREEAEQGGESLATHLIQA